MSSIRPIRVFSALDDTYVRGVSRFKVNFKNVFVGPRRKSLPTARFCNPRTLICWQDGLKSVDPPVPPRDPLYFLRLSGKNPRNDAGRIHHRSNFPLYSASVVSRGGPSRNASPEAIDFATCSTKGKKKIIDHRRSCARHRHFCASCSRGFHAYMSLPCYLLEASQRGNPGDIPLRSIPVEGVKSAISFARVVLRGTASIGGRVGGRDPGAEVARKQEREVIACWVIYLVILVDRPRGRGTRHGGKPMPSTPTRGANHRHRWKLKTHFITRLILCSPGRLCPRHPRPNRLYDPLLSSSRSSRSAVRSTLVTSCRPCSASFTADRLNMRPAIPDGTNIIKVRPHAKPVKYRCSLSPFPPHAPRLFSSAPFRPFTSSTLATGLLLSASSLYSRR